MKHLIAFTLKIFKESVLYIVLCLDLIGIIVTYYTAFKIPSWIFSSVPVVAIFLASFNIYRKSAADIRLIFDDPDKAVFKFVGGHQSTAQSFNIELKGQICNFGSHSGVINQVSLTIDSINGITDNYIVGNLPFSIRLSKSFKTKSLNAWYPNSVDRNLLEIPLIINSGDIVTFSFVIYLEVGVFDHSEIEMHLEWIETIRLRASYSITQNDGTWSEDIIINLPMTELSNLAKTAHKKRNPKFKA